MKDYKGNTLAVGDAVIVATSFGVHRTLMDGVVESLESTSEEFLGKWGLHESALIRLSDGTLYHMIKFEEKSVMKKGNE